MSKPSSDSRGERVQYAKVGDVIVCAAFVDGYIQDIAVNGEKLSVLDVTEHPLKDFGGWAAKARHDPQRATAEFVVEEASSSAHECFHRSRSVTRGYGGAFEVREVYCIKPYRVIARQLTPCGCYDPNGQLITFVFRHDDGKLYGNIIDTPIYRTRTMNRTFI